MQLGEFSIMPIKSTLVNRNIVIHGRRTSVRLEPEMWTALMDITVREKQTVHKICSMVAGSKKPETSLTAAIRVFVMAYYRAAATEDGHMNAGHGRLYGTVQAHQNYPVAVHV